MYSIERSEMLVTEWMMRASGYGIVKTPHFVHIAGGKICMMRISNEKIISSEMVDKLKEIMKEPNTLTT